MREMRREALGNKAELVESENKKMNDVMWMMEQIASEDFRDVDKTICNLVKYIDKLEDRISELEGKVVLMEVRSKLLQNMGMTIEDREADRKIDDYYRGSQEEY